MESTQIEDDKEAGRICRLCMYKQRERLPVRKSDIKLALDKENEGRKRDQEGIDRAKEIMKESIGLSIEGYIPEGKKVPTKYFVVRENKYDDYVEIPFEDDEKEEFGLLTYVFIIFYFNKGIPTTYENINSSFITANLIDTVAKFGGLKELIKKWMKQEYLVISGKKKEVETDTVYTYGPRFEVEIGMERLEEIINSIIDEGGKTEKE